MFGVVKTVLVGPAVLLSTNGRKRTGIELFCESRLPLPEITLCGVSHLLNVIAYNEAYIMGWNRLYW